MICFIGAAASAQISQSAAKAWVKKGEWRNGFKLKLYTGLDNAAFARQYLQNKKYWDEAFAYITNTKLDTVSAGKHVIDGDNVFANVSEGQTKPIDQVGWESHVKYIDLHLVIIGREKVGVSFAPAARLTKPYDAKNDSNGNLLVSSETKADYYIEDPTTLYIFFPHDAHKPGVHVDGYDKVKKLVIKIRMAE